MRGEVLQKDRPGLRGDRGNKACSTRSLKGMGFGRHGEAVGLGNRRTKWSLTFVEERIQLATNMSGYSMRTQEPESWHIYAKVAKINESAKAALDFWAPAA